MKSKNEQLKGRLDLFTMTGELTPEQIARYKQTLINYDVVPSSYNWVADTGLTMDLLTLIDEVEATYK